MQEAAVSQVQEQEVAQVQEAAVMAQVQEVAQGQEAAVAQEREVAQEEVQWRRASGSEPTRTRATSSTSADTAPSSAHGVRNSLGSPGQCRTGAQICDVRALTRSHEGLKRYVQEEARSTQTTLPATSP
jgi:hypothetical protein